ncbi:hypothetical protein B0H11DRAFT_1913671 [Mycena galericulata]|nr:hypothetical protein B0H11DRAFT_1913671 [Mycena galericulata]
MASAVGFHHDASNRGTSRIECGTCADCKQTRRLSRFRAYAQSSYWDQKDAAKTYPTPRRSIFMQPTLGLPTVPVFTGVTGAVNGMPSRPVEPLAEIIYGTGTGGR